MLELILPARVECEECFGEAPDAVLFPEEEQIISHAVPARRRDYATVRSCARTCLERLGYPGFRSCPGSPVPHLADRGAGQHDPLHRLRRRRPRPTPTDLRSWYRRRTRRTAARRRPGPGRHPAEQDRLAATPSEPDSPNWDRLLFSAKEAVYKAWFPLVGDWLDHQQAEILINPHNQTFTALLSRDELIINGHHIHRLHGRWTRNEGSWRPP